MSTNINSTLHAKTLEENGQTFFMDCAETSKKPVKKKGNQPKDCCRMCKCSFIVKYGTGKSDLISAQNLYVASSPDGEVLASMCESIGVFRAAAKSGICASYLLRSKR